MSSSRLVNFEPKWARKGLRRLSAPSDLPNLGFSPFLAPRLVTRISPKGDRSEISAITLGDTLSVTQRLLIYAGYDLVKGVKLDFAGLRGAIDPQVSQLTKLSIEPFEGGSFVIPASLSEDVEVTVELNGTPTSVRANDVLQRFSDILEGIKARPKDFSVCLGALQVIEELGKVLNREASFVEYSSVGASKSPTETKVFVVDSEFVATATESRKHRQDPRAITDAIEGQLTMVDISTGKLKIMLQGRETISGTFNPLIQDQVIQLLGRNVRLAGTVEQRLQKPRSIIANEVELMED